MKIEVRAVGLKAMREKHGLTQRQLAHDLGISQNYIHAIEASGRPVGPNRQGLLIKYFECRFDELFDVVLTSAEIGREQTISYGTLTTWLKAARLHFGPLPENFWYDFSQNSVLKQIWGLVPEE